MAVITKQDILEISEPFEEMYGDMANQILILMAEYIGQDIDEPIEVWQQKKIEQIRLLLRDVRRIQSAQVYEEMTKDALDDVTNETLNDIEPALKAAVTAGALKKAKDYFKSETISSLKKNKKNEFLQTFRNMNEEMIKGITQAFTKAVFNIVSGFQYKKATQRGVLDEASKRVYEGEARQKVVADTIKKMIAENIPAFVDKAGRKWTAEAYANMYVRTNVHNVSLDCVWKRNEEYGNDLILISKHSGARPLCAPYQGKIYSTNGRSGRVKDGKGNTIKFSALSSTSYGKPDGLFGINCAHVPYPFIPNVSMRTIKPLKKSEQAENDRIYAESQKQRFIERKIRAAKTEALALKSAGLEDTESFGSASSKIKKWEENMVKYIDETGRKRRNDREQVIAFDRNSRNLVNKAAKEYSLKKGYRDAIRKGDISSFVTLEIYKDVADKIEKKLVGIETSDGIMITGYKTHFVDRIIGQYESSNEPIKGKRKGVAIGDALETLKNPDKILEKDAKRGRSRSYHSASCIVTTNPSTGVLIQTTPKN